MRAGKEVSETMSGAGVCAAGLVGLGFAGAESVDSALDSAVGAGAVSRAVEWLAFWRVACGVEFFVVDSRVVLALGSAGVESVVLDSLADFWGLDSSAGLSCFAPPH